MLGDLGGGESFANDLNNAGTVVGRSLAGDGRWHAFQWTAGDGMESLGGFGGDAEAMEINEDGEILIQVDRNARVESSAVLRVAGTDVPVGDLGSGGTVAADLSANGHVVGSAFTADSSHAFLWTDRSGMIDLGTLAGGTVSEAVAVNDFGQVVGYGDNAAGELRVLLWNPPLGGLTPGTPAALAAAASGADVMLTWVDRGANEVGFDVLRATWDTATTSWTGWTNVVLARNTETYLDTNLPDGRYAYLVRAFNNNGRSQWATVVVWRSADATVPTAPTDLSVASTGADVRLGWSDTAGNELGYEILRARWTVGANATAYTDRPALDGRYAYLVRSYNANGSSEWTITVISHTDDNVTPPAPAGLRATRRSIVQLQWDDLAAHEQGHEVLRATWDPVSQTWGQWVSRLADVNATSIDDDTVTPGEYAYLVRTYNSIGVSPWAVLLVEMPG